VVVVVVLLLLRLLRLPDSVHHERRLHLLVDLG